MKKVKLIVVMLLVSCVLFAAGSKEKSGSVDLSFWGWIPFNNVIEPMTEAYNEANPDVNLEVQIMDWGAYWDKLTLDLAQGVGPDVFAMNLDNYSKYKDFIEPLDGLGVEVLGTDWLDLYHADMVANTRVDGELKIFPVAFSGQWFLFYNKTLLNRLGFEAPRKYADLVTISNSISNEYVPIVFGGKEDLTLAFLYLWLVNNIDPGIVAKAANGEASFIDVAFKKGLDVLAQMISDNVIPPTSFGIDPTTDADTLFTSGKGAMILTGAWQAGSYLKGDALIGSNIEGNEIGVIAMPNPLYDEPYMAGAIDHGWVINKNSQHKEKAVKLAYEWSTGKGAQIWLDALYGIPTSPNVELDFTQLASNEAKATMGNISDALSSKLAGIRSTGLSAVDNEIGSAVQAYVHNKATAEEVLSRIEKAYSNR